jgi:hypothetical protein
MWTCLRATHRQAPYLPVRDGRDLYADDEFGVELDQTVYALDASTIDLCLSLFPWAVKKQLRLDDLSLYTILQILSVTLFEKAPLLEVLIAAQYNTYSPCNDNQMKLFGY